jgi:hypothetical protein
LITTCANTVSNEASDSIVCKDIILENIKAHRHVS